VDALLRNKPSASKGQYLRTFYLTATQGPSVPVDVKEAARLQLAGSRGRSPITARLSPDARAGHRGQARHAAAASAGRCTGDDRLVRGHGGHALHGSPPSAKPGAGKGMAGAHGAQS